MSEIKLKRHIVPELNIKFIDREVEASKILEMTRGRVHVIVGPRGCGKTELFKEILYSLKDSERFYPILITYNVDSTKIYLPDLELLRRTLIERISKIVQDISGLVGALFTTFIRVGGFIIEILRFREIYGKDIVIIVDEFRNVYPGDYSRQFLDVMANDVRDLDMKLMEKNGSIRLILSTSDATASELRGKVGVKVDWYIMWNLDKKGTFDLLSDVKCPIDFELVWKITGGNPREVALLKRLEWDVKKWIIMKIADVINALVDYCQSEGENLNDTLRSIKNNFDNIYLLKVWKYLLKYNIVMYVDSRFEKISNVPDSGFFLFQVPIYGMILRSIVEKGSINVDPVDVLRIL